MHPDHYKQSTRISLLSILSLSNQRYNFYYISIFLVIFFTSHRHVYVFAQSTTSPSPSPSPTQLPLPSPSPLPFRKGRLFSVSTEGYMRDILQSDPEFINSTWTIQRHILNVESGIMQFLRDNRSPPANQSLHPCNSDGRGYVNSMRAFLRVRNLTEPDTSCLTIFEGVHNPENNNKDEEIEEQLTQDEVYDAIITRQESLFRNKQMMADKILGNWSITDVNMHYLFNRTSKKCIINHIGGLRIERKWYLFTTITNAPRRVSAPLFKRQWLNEFLHVNNENNNKSISPALKFGIAKRPIPPQTKHIMINDTTDSLASGRGNAKPFAFNSAHIEQIPALINAMDKSDLSIQQVQDALAPSSLAILLLPLSLNIIPLALITDPLTVTTTLNLIYALTTDVVTVVPLGIKGVELVAIAKERHRSIVLRMTSAVNGSLSTSAAVEIWGAECRAEDDVLTYGIIFISVALLFMVLGIILEVAARAWVIRNKPIRLITQSLSSKKLNEIQPLIKNNEKQQQQQQQQQQHATDKKGTVLDVPEDENSTPNEQR